MPDDGRLEEQLATTDLAALIDHALLDPLQSAAMLVEQVEAALHCAFAGLCVPSRQVPLAREQLGTGTRCSSLRWWVSPAVPFLPP